MNRTFHDTDTSNYTLIDREKEYREKWWIGFSIGFILGTIFTIVTIILLST